MEDLIVFLRGCLAEEQQMAEAAQDAFFYEDGHDQAAYVHLAYWDPPKVLAELDAKRRLLAAIEQLDRSADGDAGAHAWDMARALIQPYADRPGFRDDWKLP